MAEVSVTIGGYHYQLACRNGEEEHLLRLAAIVDAKSAEARSAVGNAGETRQLLLSALLLADETIDKGGRAVSGKPEGLPADLLDHLASRVEGLAERVEKIAAKP